MENDRVAIVGNSLAGMVAATRLARRGVRVTVLNGTRNWGGHFTPVLVGGKSFDPGMILHEFTSFAAMQDSRVEDYDPMIRNDAGRYCGVVRDFVENYQKVRDIEPPGMIVDGVEYADFTIANDLTTLPRLPYARAMHVDLQGLALGPRSDLHASRKHRDSIFKSTNFELVSLANHGATLHARIMEPLCQKVLNASTHEVVALYHRVPWLPLFYPETLLSFLNGAPQQVPATIFSYPVGQNVGDLAVSLKAEILASERVSVIEARPSRIRIIDGRNVEVTLASGPVITASRLAWGGALGELVDALGEPDAKAAYDRSSIRLAFLTVSGDALRRHFSVMTVIDPGFRAYRITNQTACAGMIEDPVRLSVECNCDYSAPDSGRERGDESAATAKELVDLGIVDALTSIQHIEVKDFKNALMLPSTGNLMRLHSEYDLVRRRAPTIELLGPASGFFSSSFNDQIVQGLKLALSWSPAS